MEIRHWFSEKTPYEVQEKALEFTWRRADRGYFMDMGLGKTTVTLSDFARHYHAGIVDTLLVVSPNTLKGNWIAEVRDIVDLDLSVFMYPQQKDEVRKHCQNVMVVFNYETLLTDHGSAEFDRFLEYAKCFVALDESSRLKNPKSQTTKFFLHSTKAKPARNTKIAVRRCLTGTPMTQNVVDYWGQLKFVAPTYPLGPYQFAMRYGKMGGYMGKKIVGIQNEGELTELLGRHFFIAKKKDWLKDLPEKIFKTMEYELKGELLKSYLSMKRDFLLMLSDNEVAAPAAITQLGKLLQISRGFVIDHDKNPVELVPWEDNPVVKAIVNAIDDVSGKVVVMCHHVWFSHGLKDYLSKIYKAQIPYIFGGMEAHQIQEQKALFNEGDGKLMVCQIAAGALGHTLLGTAENRCSTMIFAENVYSLEKRLQAEDRIHRIGQDRATVYIDIVGTDVDKKVVKILSSKQDLVNKLEELRAAFADDI